MTKLQSDSENRLVIWRWALWFSALTGLTQALIVAVARVTSHRLVLISSEVVWAAPAADAVVFGAASVLLWPVTYRLQRSKAAGVILSVFLFLFLLGPILIVPRLQKYAALLLAAGLAVQGARMLLPRIDWMDRIIRRTLVVVALLPVALGLWLHASGSVRGKRAEASLPAAAPGSPNVILIVLDTVRAESLSLYGYHRQTSPQLDKFAQSGVVFERALATAPWTLPSHASMFTGRLPHELSADWLTPLDNAHPTLAEALSARGYVPVAFVANLLYTTAESGLNRGFFHYSDFPLNPDMLIHESWLARNVVGSIRNLVGNADSLLDDTNRLVRKPAPDVNKEFLKWLATRPQKPFFAFLNYFDAHAPYLAPPPFDRKFASDVSQTTDTQSQRRIQRANDAYDGTIAYLDEQVGVLLTALKTQGVLENTMVLVTSDHGEQFGEHSLFEHGNGLYRQALHVPLVVSFPSQVPANLRVSRPVSLIDLPATIIGLTKAPNVEPVLPGRSLSGYWRLDHEKQVPLFSEISKTINTPDWLPASKGNMQSVVVSGMHFIRNGDGSEELYDFERDAAEEHNLARLPESHAALEEARRALKKVDRN